MLGFSIHPENNICTKIYINGPNMPTILHIHSGLEISHFEYLLDLYP